LKKKKEKMEKEKGTYIGDARVPDALRSCPAVVRRVLVIKSRHVARRRVGADRRSVCRAERKGEKKTSEKHDHTSSFFL
jgi:hypothetical protein